MQEEKQHERTTQRNSEKVFLIVIKSRNGCSSSSSRHGHMPNHDRALQHSEEKEITHALAMKITGGRETDK